MLCKKYSEK